jgi:hypothetical protein
MSQYYVNFNEYKPGFERFQSNVMKFEK